VRVTNANALLAIYFNARFGWSIGSTLGRDPALEQAQTRDLPRMLMIVIDVGTCLEVLSADQKSAIFYAFNVMASRDEQDMFEALATTTAMKRLRAGDKQGHKLYKDIAREHHAAAMRYTHEIQKHKKRKDYINAMERFRVEVEARDLYARAVRGDNAGIAC